MDTVLDMQIENILRAYQTSGIKEPLDYQKFFPYSIVIHYSH